MIFIILYVSKEKIKKNWKYLKQIIILLIIIKIYMKELELSKHYLQRENKDFTQEDVIKLWNLLSYHSDLYYNKETPIISDYEYDELFKKLQFLENKFWIKEAQTLKVWSDIIQSTFEKVRHSRPMISLDNTYNEGDLRDFDERIKRVLWLGNDKNIAYTVEFKFDWLWIELIYKNWTLVQAITRWNGVEWEDVSENVKTIKNIPKNIPYKEHLEVRWEVIMPISSFEYLNKQALLQWGKIFSNPRNAASGSLRLLDTSVTANRNLKFFSYDLANFEDFRIKENKETYHETIKDLENFGFEISSYFLECKNIEEVIKNIDNFWDLKNKIDFDIDGLVIKVNDVSLWQDIGFTAHHPRYAIAYKFPAEILTTKILSVEHQVGRTGTITPVANLEPIFITWVTVKRATLHNYDEVKNLDIKIWDNIFIKRAGEVIPKIIWVTKETRNGDEITIDIPKFCPSCNAILLQDEEKVRLYCPNNTSCPEQIKQKIIYSVGKSWFDIDGLGTQQVELFLQLWFIKDLADIFTLSEKKQELLALPWYKEKSVQNLLVSIEKSKKQKIVNLLVALNIPGIGPQSAKELSKIITSKEDLIYFNFSIDELFALQDIGEESAKNIVHFFQSKENISLIKRLLHYIEIEFKKEIIGWKFMGKKVCITGSFEGFSRDELIEKLESMWGAFVWSVSKNTDALLAWEKAGSKLEKANSLWVEVITLEDFLH